MGNTNKAMVHCRTGSLEINVEERRGKVNSSLPYRQLRKAGEERGVISRGSLPYRQLRKYDKCRYSDSDSSLPYRQLRKAGHHA